MGFAILHLKFALEGQESPQAGLRPAWPCAGYGPDVTMFATTATVTCLVCVGILVTFF
jgi:hypothetical protein